MRFLKNGELEDEKIISALHKAADDYENGELIEVRCLLMEIVNAIDEFANEGIGEVAMEPCPFCGGEGVLKQFDVDGQTIDTYRPEEIEDDLDRKIDTYPYCEGCGCELDVYETARKAIEAWNRRAKSGR